MPLPTRNSTLGFVLRTRKNLDFVKDTKDTFEQETDVHVLTQVVSSLLGLIVVPWADNNVRDSLKEIRLESLSKEDWPKWHITLGKDKTQNLFDLIRHLRNAAAHGRFEFQGESESQCLHKVVLEVHDVKWGETEPYWRAKINGQDLYSFCQRFAKHVEDILG